MHIELNSCFVYLFTVLSPTTDRLGDSKDCVREQAKALLSRLMNFVSTPQVSSF